MKNILRKITAAMLVLSFSIGLFAGSALAATFRDVPEESWAYEYVERAAANGLVNGYGDGDYGIGDKVKNSQWSKMVVSLLFSDDYTVDGESFWWSGWMSAAHQNGVLEGTTVADGYLEAAQVWENDAVEAYINRYDMAQVIYNAAKIMQWDTGDTENIEASIPDWSGVPAKYREAVKYCYASGFILGMDDKGTFAGAETMTRGQAAAVLCRMLDATEGKHDFGREEDAPVFESVVKKVALVTDVGTIDDESFNQACWQGVEAWCKREGVTYAYYQPREDSHDARVNAIVRAVSEGANVVVLPGYLFGTAIISIQNVYPEVYFIAIDVGEGDLSYDYVTYYEPTANVSCITFKEEQAGYLAGYAAVMDGYTKLGFLGGMAVPAVVRYGYGFAQGANDAAAELAINIEMNYAYAGQFFGDDFITAKVAGWYSAGTEVIFACGGALYTSVVSAALWHDGRVIGVDVDQNYIGEYYGIPNPFLTSAMKGLQAATEAVLAALKSGEWEAEYAGQFVTLGLADGDFVGLPTNAGSWGFSNFAPENYSAVLAKIRTGEIFVDDSVEVSDISVYDFTNVTVKYVA